MLSCRKATGLIVRKSETNLNLLQRIQLFFHLRACEACRAFESQSETIDQMVKKQRDKPPSLSASEKKKIKEKVSG